MKKKPIKLAIMCHKGGTGKTTTTLALADAFSNMGHKVLIIDADEQSNIKTIFGLKLNHSEGGLAAILLENIKPESIAIKVRDKIDVILSGGRLMREFEKAYANAPDAELLMRKRLDKIDAYDIILIDTPPALSLISINIVAYSDHVLLTCSPDLLALVGVKNTLNFIENIEGVFNKTGINIANVLGIIPTLHDSRRNIDITILDDLHRLKDADLLKGGTVFSPIRNDIKVKTAQVRRKLLSEAFPSAKATQDYLSVAHEIVNRVISKAHRKLQKKEAQQAKNMEI